LVPGRRVPGQKDLGALVRFHEEIYWKEYRYDRRFGAYVAKGLADMALRYDDDRDRLWLVRKKGHIIGSVAIVHRSRTSAQLRWFLVAPAFRRRGLGKRLMGQALDDSKLHYPSEFIRLPPVLDGRYLVEKPL